MRLQLTANPVSHCPVKHTSVMSVIAQMMREGVRSWLCHGTRIHHARVIYERIACRRVQLELLPYLAAQLQLCVNSQPKATGSAAAQQPGKGATAETATIRCVLAAQRRLPRIHPLARPLAGACAAAASAHGACQATAVAVLERITALLPSADVPLWPQVRIAGCAPTSKSQRYHLGHMPGRC